MKYPGVRPIPKRISYRYPNGHKRRGTVSGRVLGRSSGKGGDYLLVIEKILWEGSQEPTVRFGYYKRET